MFQMSQRPLTVTQLHVVASLWSYCLFISWFFWGRHFCPGWLLGPSPHRAAQNETTPTKYTTTCKRSVLRFEPMPKHPEFPGSLPSRHHPGPVRLTGANAEKVSHNTKHFQALKEGIISAMLLNEVFWVTSCLHKISERQFWTCQIWAFIWSWKMW